MDDVTKPRRRPLKPASSTYHHGDLRNALLREGRGLLEALGATEMSLREVARRAGVSEAAPSRHFEGKEGLLAHIAADGFRELATLRREVLSQGLTRLETVRGMLLTYVRYAQQNKGLFNLMIGPRILDPQRYAELAEVSKESFQLFSGAVVDLALEQGWKKKDVEFVAHTAWAMEHGLATLILADRAPSYGSSIDLDTMIGFAVDMTLSAIVAGPVGLAGTRASVGRRTAKTTLGRS